jgi:hypothetical protein
MPASTSAVPARRRPHSARVAGGAAVLAVTTLAGILALAARSPALLTATLVAAVAAGWLVLRLACTELRLARRQHARERAWQAAGFREHATRTAAEHTTFAAALTRHLAVRDRNVRELEGTLRLSEARADAAEDRVRREVRRLDEARGRIVELEVALAIRRAEEADELATWEPGGPEVDTVVDLLAWEDRTRSASDARRLRRHA